jgi:hypothetical protein
MIGLTSKSALSSQLLEEECDAPLDVLNSSKKSCDTALQGLGRCCGGGGGGQDRG